MMGFPYLGRHHTFSIHFKLPTHGRRLDRGVRKLIIYYTFSRTGSISPFHWKEHDAGRQIKGMGEEESLG